MGAPCYHSGNLSCPGGVGKPGVVQSEAILRPVPSHGVVSSGEAEHCVTERNRVKLSRTRIKIGGMRRRVAAEISHHSASAATTTTAASVTAAATARRLCLSTAHRGVSVTALPAAVGDSNVAQCAPPLAAEPVALGGAVSGAARALVGRWSGGVGSGRDRSAGL